ncbi:hypothetical protein [Breoghania sp.]|uniref:hypothetical protein n=1 Tax=Breoghania sp. TaxID=2065378 RepID=UPI0026160C4D|nr:hypothetical protein [Breoghania sp.]MDJ0929930.1 hypothetical protein [Breoghania sp.]
MNSLQALNEGDPDLNLVLTDQEVSGFYWSGQDVPIPLIEELGPQFDIGLSTQERVDDTTRMAFRLDDGKILLATGFSCRRCQAGAAL